MEKEEGIVGIIKNYSKNQQPEAYSSKCTASFSRYYIIIDEFIRCRN